MCSCGDNQNFLLYFVNRIELYGVGKGVLGGMGYRVVRPLEWPGEQSFQQIVLNK